MQFLVLIYGNEKNWQSMPKEELQQSFTAFMQYNRDLAKSGALRGGEQLQPTHTAKTARARGGTIEVTDGPFAETKEQLGGYYLLELGSLDEAMAWAAKCPAVYGGSIEVRPILAVDRGDSMKAPS